MTNVVDFQSEAPRIRASALRSPDAGAAIPDRMLRVERLHSHLRSEVHRSILLLDLAAQHAREIEARIMDPEARRAFEVHIAAIEDAIQTARERALEL